MSAAGDAVVAIARGEIGITEDPPGSNAVKYWIPWSGSEWGYGPWCAAFVSWVQTQAGYAPCWVDGPQGFTLVSNGTLHAYSTGGDGATGLEAQRTVDLQPGDTVCFSWEPWAFEGGIPICQGDWQGYVAGDHTGIASSAVDGDGYFWCVEGNTSPTDAGSQDNGGGVWEKQRHISQVCGWWRQESIAGGAPAPPEPTYNLTGLGMFLLSGPGGVYLCGPGYSKGLTGEEYAQVSGIPGIATFNAGDNQRAVDVILSACMAGFTAEET